MPRVREKIPSRPAMLGKVVEAQLMVRERCPYNSHGLDRATAQQSDLQIQVTSNGGPFLKTSRLYLQAICSGTPEWAQGEPGYRRWHVIAQGATALLPPEGEVEE